MKRRHTDTKNPRYREALAALDRAHREGVTTDVREDLMLSLAKAATATLDRYTCPECGRENLVSGICADCVWERVYRRSKGE